MFSLPRSHRFAGRENLRFSDMNGERMLLFSDIGFWSFVRTEMMPDSRFLTQSDRSTFTELVLASSLPSFTSDAATRYFDLAEGRVSVPISDTEATVTYYLVCMEEKRKAFAALFSAI